VESISLTVTDRAGSCCRGVAWANTITDRGDGEDDEPEEDDGGDSLGVAGVTGEREADGGDTLFRAEFKLKVKVSDL